LWIVVALGVVFAFRPLLVLFAGVLFAISLAAAARWLSRISKLPYWAAVTGIVLLGVCATVAAAVLLAPSISEQVQTLSDDLPKAVHDARVRLGHTPVLGKTLEKAADSAAPKAEPKNLAIILVGALGGTVDVLAGLVVIFFVGVYGAAQPGVYARAVLEATPRRYHARVEHALDKTVTNLSRWLLGRLAAMAFVGITTTIAFHFLRIPLAPLLGAFAGLLTFVEYVGAIASAVPPLILGLAQSPAAAIGVLVTYTALHLIEGYVLTPLFARASVHLPPALTLAAQVILAALAGPLALTFSTPLFVVGVSAVEAWRESGQRSAT
jgi:predicted PurR-regulated permease PerM